MMILSKFRYVAFGMLSMLIALASLRFILLGMDNAFPNMAHQLTETNVMFYLHVTAGPVALAIAPFQLSDRFRRSSPIRHRWLGRSYCLMILLAGISGIVIGFDAMHGLVAQTGFIALGIAWLVVTFVAYQKARERRFVSHRDWMIRSVSLTFAAVTLRLWLALSALTGIPFEISYPVIAWLCWVPNLLFAEFLVGRKWAA